jgi:hypothetical protein
VPVGHPVGDVVEYMRAVPGQTILVAINLGRRAVDWTLPEGSEWSAWQPRLGSVATRSLDEALAAGSTLVLAADEALILEGVR